jgi:two-component system sensor histidine kinase KdpD
MVTEVKQPGPDSSPAGGQTQAQIRILKAWQWFLTRIRPLTLSHRWSDYLWSLGFVVLATLIGLPFASLDHANIVMLYLLVEVIAAVRFGLGPSILAALASVIAYHYFFIVPRFTFAVGEAQYLLTFTGLLMVGLVISTLVARAREQALAAQRREAQTAASYDFSRSLAETVGREDVIQTTITHIKRVIHREVVILLPDGDKLAALDADIVLSEDDYAVAVWVYQHGQPAGRGTQTLPAAIWRFHPLKTARGVGGVLGVKPPATGTQLTPDQFQLLEIFANQAAVAIERTRMAEQVRQAELLRETEKLQAALLSSISHDLRTPLASITGVLSTLGDDESYLDETTRRELIENAYEEADRMNRLVANLLDMTRLEAGAVNVTLEPCDVQDVIGVALEQLTPRLQDRPVTVTIPDDLPLVPMDFVLISHVLLNLIDNAHKYSPPNSPIEIQAEVTDNQVQISVIDHGLGIPPDELTRVFEKFYRVPRAEDVSGTGLGLSICQGIVETHHGRIWAANRSGGGAILTMTLPLGKPAPTEVTE